MKYVEVKNGQIVGDPKSLSNSRTAVPNTKWSDEQMKMNGFFRVDTDIDEVTEELGEATITEDSVVYEKKRLRAEKVQANKKERKIKAVTARITDQIFDEVSLAEMIFALMGYSDIEIIKSKIGNKVQKLQSKIAEINNATDVDSVDEN